jgi:hypothetical protein
MYGVKSSFGEIIALFEDELEATKLAIHLREYREPVNFYVEYLPEYATAQEYIEQH